MAKKLTYKLGDVFEFDLDEGGKGYGRVLKIEQPSVFIELFKIAPNNPVELSELEKSERILSIWSVDTGLKKGLWRVIGNIPVLGEVKMPTFWKRDAFDCNKIILIRGDESFEVSQDEIGNAQPYGIFGHDAVRIRYVHELKQRGIL